MVECRVPCMSNRVTLLMEMILRIILLMPFRLVIYAGEAGSMLLRLVVPLIQMLLLLLLVVLLVMLFPVLMLIGMIPPVRVLILGMIVFMLLLALLCQVLLVVQQLLMLGTLLSHSLTSYWTPGNNISF